jgi:hypothetical protein
MKKLSLLAFVLLTACATRPPAAAPVTVVVSMGDPAAGDAEAARFRTIIEESVRRWAHPAKPLLVSVAITHDFGTSRTFSVPITESHQIYSPRSMTTVTTATGSYSSTVTQKVLAGTYVVTDAAGNVVDHGTLSYATPDGTKRLEKMHAAAEYIARRVDGLRL